MWSHAALLVLSFLERKQSYLQGNSSACTSCLEKHTKHRGSPTAKDVKSRSSLPIIEFSGGNRAV